MLAARRQAYIGVQRTTAAAAARCSLARYPLRFLRDSSRGSNRAACSSQARTLRNNWPARLPATRVGTAGTAGKRSLSSFVPRGRGLGDSTIVNGLVGLNLAGTVALFLHETQGTGGPFLFHNLMVSSYTTLTQGRLHTLFISNFSHSNLWDGAFFSYMMYPVGPTAIQHLGRRTFLALYLLGGAFSQLCQVAGPDIARRLGLPTVLQVDPYFVSSGGSGPVLTLMAWYCATFPGSRIIPMMVVPAQTGIAGGLFLGAVLYQVVTNGAAGPVLGPTHELWRTLGASAAGVAVAVAARGRGGGGGRYKFIQRR